MSQICWEMAATLGIKNSSRKPDHALGADRGYHMFPFRSRKSSPAVHAKMDIFLCFFKLSPRCSRM